MTNDERAQFILFCILEIERSAAAQSGAGGENPITHKAAALAADVKEAS